MIRGVVNANGEPLASLTLILQGKRRRFQAVLDTGFNGYLSVPQSMADRSGWYFSGYEEYEIATGDRVRERVYLGEVISGGDRMTTHVVTSRAKDILIGTRMLSRHELHIDFKKRSIWVRKSASSKAN